MKADFNKFNLIGRLVKDGELISTANGIEYCHIVIVNNSKKKINGEYQKYPNFFDLKIFGKYGESITPYMKKGQQVLATCSVEQSRWEKDGVKRSGYTFYCEDIQLVGSLPGTKASEDVPSENEVPAEEVPAETLSEKAEEKENFDFF